MTFSKYYSDQLAKLNLNTDYYLTIVLSDGEGNITNNLNLNKESIKVLKAFLDQYLQVQNERKGNKHG